MESEQNDSVAPIHEEGVALAAPGKFVAPGTCDESMVPAAITHKPGVARVKPEFLKTDHRIEVSEEYLSKDTKDKIENLNKRKADGDDGAEGSSPSKKMRLKGRNKKRPVVNKLDSKEKLCPSVLHEQHCRFGEKCKFSHDVQKFIANKPADLGPDCHIFEVYGQCRYGIACRYGSKHISEDFKNIINKDLVEKMSKTKHVTNLLEKELQVKLWKKKYDFEKANKNANRIQREVKAKLDQKQNAGNTDSLGQGETSDLHGNVSKDLNELTPECATSSEGVSSVETNNGNGVPEIVGQCNSGNAVVENVAQCGSMEDSDNTKLSHVVKSSLDEEGIKLRPQEKKLIDFSNKLYLAPLTTVGNLPFRRICKGFGADVTCGEMALATNILQGQQSEWALLKRHSSEDLFGVQICGAWPDTLTRCCQLINDELNVDFVDLNCGCPIDLVFKKGEGCALMGKSNKFEQIIRSMKSVLDIPLTVKMRTGIFDDKKIAHYLAPKLRDWGASLVTLHGRSREQRYTRLADWDYINKCANLASPMPFFGNGDVMSFEDWNSHMENTGVSGCMIARGALIKPWIFQEIKERRHWDISAGERFDMLKTFVNNGLEHWGSDQQGVETTRRFLLEWLSFTYRYIPVGVLEQVPQKINERPPFYVGRSDLETLLSSPNCGDWIKISEMLLGPVPDSFSFLPKHKANAYK